MTSHRIIKIDRKGVQWPGSEKTDSGGEKERENKKNTKNQQTTEHVTPLSLRTNTCLFKVKQM